MDYADARQSLFCAAAATLKDYHVATFRSDVVSLGTLVRATDAITAIPSDLPLPDHYHAAKWDGLVLEWFVSSDRFIYVVVENNPKIKWRAKVDGVAHEGSFEFNGQWPKDVLGIISQVKAEDVTVGQ